jgi:4a-hydroxytetrahydrobiopterin dehydratase
MRAGYVVSVRRRRREEDPMPELLDDQSVRSALADLDGWEGDGKAIRRTVTIPAEQQPHFRSELEAIARSMNHDPDLEVDGDTVTVVMSTHSSGGVTELDVEYARKVNTVVDAIAS